MRLNLLVFTLLLVLLSCTEKVGQTPTTSSTTVTTTTLTEAPDKIILSWETPTKPERFAWSNEILSHLEKNFDTFSLNTDFTRVCPKFGTLTKTQKIKALGEFWVAVAYKESSWNPASSSVDVGTKGDKGSWSVGLYQVSANDGGNIYKYTYEELKDPVKNIKVSMEILRRQLKNTGKYILPNNHKSKYWAVILDGNKYNQLPWITSRTLENAPYCK